MEKAGSWQNTGREPKLWIMNSTTSFPLVLLIIRASKYTLGLVVVTIGVFFILDYYGFKPPVFVRYIRSFLAGGRKTARPWWV